MKRKLLFFLAILLIACPSVVLAQSKTGVKKIVIDAGHGGNAPGGVGKVSKEKDITLSVALMLGKLIEKHMPEVQTIYTRKTDVAVELYKRAEIANTNHADLFISIHCNATQNQSAHGVETWVMGVDKSEASIAVAKKENAEILLEKDHATNYDGFNPNSTEASAIFSLYVSSYLKNSAILASKVQTNLVKNSKLTDRSVRQAGFWVLYKVTMPSILIELGFLSNAKEEQFLIKKSTQEMMAISIYNAIVAYKNQMDGTNYSELSLTGAVLNGPAPELKPDTKPNTNTVEKPASSATEKPAVKKNGVSFRVQIASSKENLSVNDARFKQAPNVKKYYENGLWKFTAGDEATFEAAAAIQRSIKPVFKDCFVIAFKDDKKINVSEARKLVQ